MQKEETTDSSYPGIAFAILPATGETIAIQFGQRIFYRVETTKTADELNAIYGVTPAQAQAMLERVLAGWETPPVLRDNHESLRRSA